MPDATTSLVSCDESLPLSPIMRQFDFGQFVFLHEQSQPAQANPRKDVSRQIVIDPSGGALQARQEWLERMQQVKLPGGTPRPPRSDVLGGVSLQGLFHAADPLSPVEMHVEAAGFADVIDERKIDHGGKQYSLDLDHAAADALSRGEPALALAVKADGSGKQFMSLITPDLPSVTLNPRALDSVLASGEVQSDGNLEHVEVGVSVSRALLAGEAAVVRTAGDHNALLRLVPPAPVRPPAESSVDIPDLAEFLGQPRIEGADGLPIDLELNAGQVRELRAAGATTVPVAGTSVRVRNTQFARRLSNGDVQVESLPRPPSEPKTRVPTAVGPPAGLKVAVFMPWRQTWELTGFSRGELRSSLALAPEEETTIEVSSWERRLRTLDQSSETDVEQVFDSSATERESDDVFREMTKHHDFNWQVGGSLDATYSTGNGSIHLAAQGQVADASQLQSIARDTHQGLKESTQKSSAKIRSLRTTHITDSIEGTSQSRVTRHLKNPNLSHTLTLDFFETLAHYKVTLAAIPKRLRLVALVDNPVYTKEFTRELVRRNEIALRRALLDSSLVDGFDACRKTTAYTNAIAIIKEQALMGAPIDNAIKSDVEEVDKSPLPPSVEEKAVAELLKQIAATYKTVSTSAKPNISGEPTQLAALTDIAANKPVDPDWRADAQHCLFLQLCRKCLPGLLHVISKLPSAPTIDNAGALYAVIPPPGEAMSLTKFADLSYKDKEEAGLGTALMQVFGGGTMGRSNGLALNANLYTPDDAGLGRLIDSLWMAYKAYLAKQSEGEFKKDKDAAITAASAEQDKLSTADKLAMAFPLDELASARERQEALLAHLNEHPGHYSFALFQGLSPAEQSRYIEDSGLEVGMFEPRVLAVSGSELAVPLAPPPAGALRDFIESLRKSFATAFGSTADDPDYFIFPTPGITISSRLGECSACEKFIEDSRTIELRRLAAGAESAELEASRRAARIKANELGDPAAANAALHISVDEPA